VRVQIRDRKGKGKIVIEYSNLEDFDRVLEMLAGSRQSWLSKYEYLLIRINLVNVWSVLKQICSMQFHRCGNSAK